MGEAEERRGRPVAIGAAAVAGAMALWTAVTWLAARAQGFSPFSTNTWGRWDTGWYRTIALDGYSFGHCDSVPNRAPTDYCGATGWFPGYPYLNRAVSHLGMSVDTAGRWVSLVGLVALFAVVWFGFLAKRPLAQAIPAMGLVAVFPGSIYYGAIFPVSITCASMLGTLALMQRRRWLAAGVVGMVAAVSYPSGATIAIAAAVPFFWPALGSWWDRIWAAVKVGGPIAAGYLLVLLNFDRAVGHWDAWFRVQEAYGYEPSWPNVTIWHQLQLMFHSNEVRTPGAQTAIVLALVVAGAIVAARSWRTFGPGERAAVVVVAALWIVPLVLGGDLSLYRAESLLVPVVVVLARAHRWVLWAFVVACLPVAYNMAQLFFDNTLT